MWRWMGLLLLGFMATHANAAESVVLSKLWVQTSASGETELVLQGQGLDQPAQVFTSGQQWVLDIEHADASQLQDHYPIANHGMQDVLLGSDQGRVRLVVTLQEGMDVQGNVQASVNEMRVRWHVLVADATHAVETAMVEDVQFKPHPKGGVVHVYTNQNAAPYKLQEAADRVIIIIPNTSLKEGQERTQDVRAFMGPIAQVDSFAQGVDVHVVVRLQKNIEHTLLEKDGRLSLSVFEKPEVVVVKQPVLEGQNVTMNYKDMDLVNALRMLAELNDYNIVLHEGVQGKLTISLKDVPWEQALSVILQTQGLGQQRMGNIIRIAPLEMMNTANLQQIDGQQSAETVAPLETRYFRLHYARAKDVESMLKGQSAAADVTMATSATTPAAATASAATQDAGASLLSSSRGIVLLDERNNQLIVTDTYRRLEQIEQFISNVDIPVKQILISARIVEAQDSFSRELGVRWGAVPQGATQAGVFNTPRGALLDLPGNGGTLTGTLFGQLAAPINLNLELSAAEADGKIKVVSSPRVITNNLEEALIEESDDIPFSQTTISGGATTNATVSKESKLMLKVTPTIAGGKVMMTVEVNKDTPRQNDIDVNGQPIINKKRVKTALVVNDGETIVLGGIYSESENEVEGGVPLLKDIPLLGYAFKNSSTVKKRTELLVFLTPTIIEQEPLR